MLKAWPVISEETVYEAGIFRLQKKLSTSPKDGQDKEIFAINSRSWAMVLAVTPDNHVPLVRQSRHASQNFSLELPGGIIEEKQTPLEAAQRELREETGFAAESWSLIKALRPNPAIIDNTVYGFLATGAALSGPTAFDDNEDIELILTPITELKNMIIDGRIDHAIMVAMISLYLLMR